MHGGHALFADRDCRFRPDGLEVARCVDGKTSVFAIGARSRQVAPVTVPFPLSFAPSPNLIWDGVLELQHQPACAFLSAVPADDIPVCHIDTADPDRFAQEPPRSKLPLRTGKPYPSVADLCRTVRVGSG